MTTKIVLIKIKAILGTMSTMTSLVYWPMAPYDHMRKKTGKWEVALADISLKRPQVPHSGVPTLCIIRRTVHLKDVTPMLRRCGRADFQIGRLSEWA